ncbi:unnamed protein product [Microthlaspi erraticum]|uniref:NET domain-containing protein n=1 Tax=Microthlaspi erraticum TaxID=1685480 RepID=A0A6D2KNV6_9BRAS|nr:unnamed protein product [Microthlaspi erraticum]
MGGDNVIRVHNVRDNVDAARLCDAMMRREGQTIGRNKKLKTITSAPEKPEEEEEEKEEEVPVNIRDLTSDEKRRLSEELLDFPHDKIETVVQIIKKRNPEPSLQDGEIELDLDSVDMETLWDIYGYVTEYKESLSKIMGFHSIRDAGSAHNIIQEQTTLASGSSGSSSSSVDSSGFSSSG